MLQAPWWVFGLMIVLLPVAVVALFFAHKSLPQRLTIFLVSGFIVNHWMQVWCYRLKDRLEDPERATNLNSLFLFSMDWRWSLLLGFAAYILLYVLLSKVWIPEEKDVTISLIAFVGIGTIIISQAASSSVPKLAIEVGILGIYLLGLISWKYFLVYPEGFNVGATQVQSDSLTSFGLMLSFLALWLPATLTLGDFLYKYYQNQGELGVQLQMTRYATGVAYSLSGFAVVIMEILRNLIEARLKMLS